MLFSIAKKSGLHRELKKNKKIRASYKKRYNSSRNSSSDEPDSDYSLSSDRDLDKYRKPSGSKEMNILDHVVTGNIKKTKDQLNDAI